MQRLADAIVGVLIAAFVAGLALMPLSSPVVVRGVFGATYDGSAAGLPPAEALDRAVEARALVLGSVDSVTKEGPGVRGFDEASVSHLRDVRDVLSAARVATGLAAAILAIWLGFQTARRRVDEIARGLRAGSVACVLLVVLAGLLALLDFDWFFAGFHSLFFDAGTWTFPPGTLLIELFPQAFWQWMGIAWAGLILVGAAVCEVAARLVMGAGRRRSGGTV